MAPKVNLPSKGRGPTWPLPTLTLGVWRCPALELGLGDQETRQNLVSAPPCRLECGGGMHRKPVRHLWAELSSMQVSPGGGEGVQGDPLPWGPSCCAFPRPLRVALGGAGQRRWEAGTKPETTSTLSVRPSSLWTCFSAILFLQVTWTG